MGYYKKEKNLPPFVALGRQMLKSKEWCELSSSAKILYIYLKYKFTGSNNGNIRLPYSEMKNMMSSATIAKAFHELLRKEWVEKTKIGGLYRYSNLYKLNGKYDEIMRNYGF